ncbi:hypothetical protein [Dysgonomonas sp. BGC7]|uniref:hypothetical protein n=1 Tax=Dysgonomonas sp. BGC7 TaxID=1658008 RepID=UPI0006836FD4|nr:hypothetical protein [Dysgonomonas sp. BGC7]MBD8389637.1 hypothetical protein [Dysgonomonas sp. BGC7]
MSKKAKQTEFPPIIARCEYCRNNEGENKRFGHMWKCKALGYCVPLGYGVIVPGEESLHYCEAIRKAKGFFVLDEEKYKQFEKDKR